MRAFLLRLYSAIGPYWGRLGGLALLLLGLALAAPRWPLLALPGLGLVVASVLLTRWKWLFYLLFLTLPFSFDLALPLGGLHLDVPSEPLLLGLLLGVPLALRRGLGHIYPHEWRHPLLVLPALMLAWAAFDTFFSVNVLHSVKYLLAKCWYLVPCLLGSLVLLRRPADFWRVAACYALGTAAVLCWTLPRQAGFGFEFFWVNRAIAPFFSNHVIYATLLALLLPLVVGLLQEAPTRPQKRLWWVVIGLLCFGLITAYTRASWLSLPAAWCYYWIMRKRRTAWLLALVAAITLGAVVYLVQDNHYQRFAPNYKKTIWHGNSLRDHLASTYKLEDMSGMERVYRWIAAARMVAAHPLTGTGPSTFTPTYKNYVDPRFRTYVSDNTENSTVHNYFLLQLAEQGVPGFVLFCALVTVALLTAERRYHASAHRPEVRRVVLAANLSLVIILFHLSLNELLEVDKVGTIYLLYLAVLIRSEAWLREPAPLGPASQQLATQAATPAVAI